MNKAYATYLMEISSSEIYEGLLAHGLFSNRLPPFLSSELFFDYCQREKPKFSKRSQIPYIHYDAMRNINIPRCLGIPNPTTYQLLCECISDNWSSLQDHFYNKTLGQMHKVSQKHFRKQRNSKRLYDMNYPSLKSNGALEANLLIGKKYLVKADIAECFSSIYSHSLPWALVGKSIAKSRKTDKTWYNDLDKRVQNIKNGETHGLIIGPDASNLLSEIILTSIDEVLYKQGYRYVRIIDDYFCYVDSYKLAQDFLVDLSKALQDFDLLLNYKKTEITKLPTTSEERWVTRLKTTHLINRVDTLGYKDVRAYMDLAMELIHDNQENSAIINYAIKVLSGKHLDPSAKEYLVKFVSHLSIIYPYLLPLLEEHLFTPFKVATSDIEQISNRSFSDGMEIRNYDAVCFALYFSLKYGFQIKGISYDAIEESKDCLTLLLGFLYFKKYSDTPSVKRCEEFARKLSTDNDNYGKYWLFIYEVLQKSELRGYWTDMKEKGVSFIRL